MEIAILAWEAAPFARGGSLADRIGELCEALSQRPSHKVTLILPRHNCIDRRALEAVYEAPVTVRAGGSEYICGIFSFNYKRIRVLFVEHDLLFARTHSIYEAEGNEDLKAAVFTRAAIAYLAGLRIVPDCIIANEWQCALAPAYIKCFYSERLSGTKAALHVQSFEHGGIFNKYSIEATGLGWEAFCEEHLKYNDDISYLKSGIIYADAVLSDTFDGGESCMLPGFDALTGARRNKCKSVLPWFDAQNPVDTATKQFRREALLLKTGLNRDDVPLFAFTGRGGTSSLSLLLNIVGTVLSENKALFCIHHDGRGDTALLQSAELLSRSFPGKVALYSGENEEFEDDLLSGADFLIQSCAHPDARSLLRAFSARTIPVVRKSSISQTLCHPANAHERGILFAPAVEYQLYKAVCAAISLYASDKFADLQEHAAACTRGIDDYIDDYTAAIESTAPDGPAE